MKNKFTLNINNFITDSEGMYLRENYQIWREFQQENVSNFLILNDSFKQYLPVLKTGALNLYLFYSFHSKNKTGENWYSLDTLAKELNTSKRSIINWNEELDSLGLIYRQDEGKISKTTFLMPTSNFFLDLREKTNFREYKKKYKEEIDGKLVSIYHIFQWRKNKTDGKFNVPHNTIVFVFERNYEKDNYSFSIRKYVLFYDENIANVIIDKSNLIDNIYLFDSPFILKDKTIEIKGIAISTQYNFKNNSTDILDILNELRDNESQLTKNNFKTVKIDQLEDTQKNE